jgi:hypothetical protein
MKKITALLLLSILFACTATFNWREIRSDEQGYSALFPAKTTFEQKQFPFKDRPIDISLEASNAGEAIFAIGTLKLDEKNTSSDELLAAMQNNAQKSIANQTATELLKTSFTLAGEGSSKVPGEGYQLAGKSPDGLHRIYWVYWVKRSDNNQITRLYQLTAIKAFKQKPTEKESEAVTEQFSTFLGGFRPY